MGLESRQNEREISAQDLSMQLASRDKSYSFPTDPVNELNKSEVVEQNLLNFSSQKGNPQCVKLPRHFLLIKRHN